MHGATIDSRKVRPGMLFACFVGERVDGHDYAETAVGDGAVVVLAQRQLDLPVPVVVVTDVAQALAQLAQQFRQQYTGACWLGITGSNGKTTVKELLTVLLQAAGPVHATVGNYNNELGVPLTVLSTPPGCRHVVVEMGAGRQGDIRYLAQIAQPEVGIITSIGPAHLDGFGDIEGVASGKGEMFAGVPAGGPCYLGRSGSAEQDQVQHLLEQAAVGRDLLIVGDDHHIAEQLVDFDGPACRFAEVTVPLHGQHNASNLRLALRVARDRGLPLTGLQQGLRRLRPVAGRLVELRCGQHTILDDSYNANPASMEAGLQELARRPGGRIAVLGAMAELGPESEALHRRVGAQAAYWGLPLVTVAADGIAAGYRAAGGRDLITCCDVGQAVAELQACCTAGPRQLLIKASRSAGLDRLVNELMDGKELGAC